MQKINENGRFPAVVQSAEFGESGEKGTPYLCLTFAGDGETTTGTISGFLYLSEKALENTLKTLRDAFGFDGNFETAIEQVTGKPCSITNETEEYNGTDRVKVKWINAPRNTKPIADQASFLKSLTAKAARIPARVPAGAAPTRSVPATRPPPATRQAPPARTAAPAAKAPDDDVPF